MTKYRPPYPSKQIASQLADFLARPLVQRVWLASPAGAGRRVAADPSSVSGPHELARRSCRRRAEARAPDERSKHRLVDGPGHDDRRDARRRGVQIVRHAERSLGGHRYASEFEFRWNTSKMTDAERVQMMVDARAGKRLTYRPLTHRRHQG